jgi:hypothetical protein
VHDMLLYPAYTTLDRVGRRARPAGWANYVRIPVAISGLLLLVFFPVVCGKGERAYTRVSGVGWDGYAERWLIASAVVFAVAAVLYGLRAGSRS